MNYKKNKKITKKYIKEFEKKLEDLFWSIGTIQVRHFGELSWLLDIEEDDRIKQALKDLEKRQKVSILFKGIEFWIDYIPF